MEARGFTKRESNAAGGRLKSKAARRSDGEEGFI